MKKPEIAEGKWKRKGNIITAHKGDGITYIVAEEVLHESNGKLICASPGNAEAVEIAYNRALELEKFLRHKQFVAMAAQCKRDAAYYKQQLIKSGYSFDDENNNL